VSFVYAVHAALLLASQGLAEVRSVPLELTWSVPAECPQESAFLASVTRLVGGAGHITRGVIARVKVDKDANANYTLELTTELNGIAGERILRGHSCHAVTDAAVITLALILNPDIELLPDANEEPGILAAKPQPAEAVPAQSPIENAIYARTSPPSPYRLTGLGTSTVGIHFGVLPQPVPELSLGVGVAYGRLSAFATGGYAPPTNALLRGQRTQGGRIWTASATAVGCWALADVAPRLGTCLGAEWVRVQGYGFGVPQSRRGATDWVSPTIGLFADFPLGSRGLFRLMALGMAPLHRPNTHLDNFGTVQRPSEIAAKLDAGVIVSFP
jgi:hypothetical protein